MSDTPTTVRLVQRAGYQFDNEFGNGLPTLLSDEPAPLGTGTGPSPVQLLGAAVGNCLAASLQFALAKYKQSPGQLRCEVALTQGRNAERRLRILGIEARITLGVAGASIEHLDRVLASFEDFCTVTGSVRQGIPTTVLVFDSAGVQLK